MELKNYQEKVLRDLESYINNILDTGSISRAYSMLWESKGVRVGGSEGIQPYNDLISGVPSVCFKVPTGGGKTILGCAALKHIFNVMNPDKKKVVVWLVPWETILTQTYNSLKNPSHFYRKRLNRDFSSKVEIYNKQQVLNGANFNPTVIDNQLSIILMSFDSLRTTNKDGRKVYEENSNLLSFVSTFDNRENLIDDVDESSLMQVLNQQRPIVIIDESHNAQSELSKEMIKNLNPSFVIELTATPKNDSNIISIVTANQLKDEHMVKLPVIAYNRPTVERVIVEALDLRNALEEKAKIERQEKGIPYIRPIVLFQAQPRSDDDSVTFERLKENLISAGIPAEEIAIKTASKNELAGIDLMSEQCKIRYIITVNALKEGWDCPFAYILASLANRTSKIDVEQILGRILRQPHQKKYDNKILNMSYVLTSSNDFSETLDNILKGLNSAGFTRNDCRVIRTRTLESVTNSTISTQTQVEQTSIFDNNSNEDIEADNNIFNVETVNQELVQRVVNEESTSTFVNENIDKMISQAEIQNEEYEEEIIESQRLGTTNIPEEVQRYSNVYLVKEEHRLNITSLKIPTFVYRMSGTIFGDNVTEKVSIEYLNSGFNLDIQRLPNNITTSTDNVYQVDIETTNEGSVVKKSLLSRNDDEEFKRLLSLVPEESIINHCRSRLIGELNNRFDCIDQASIGRYVDRIIASLTTEDEIVALKNNIMTISLRIKNHINDLLAEYRYNNFKQQLVSNIISIEESIELPLSIILPNSTSNYLRTLYEEEDSRLDSYEEKFADKISSLDNVKWWHRNIDRTGFKLNGFVNHYPDFIVATNSGVIILVETKGEHLDGDDSKKKLELGQLWANNAGPNKYKYFMAFDRTPLNENGAGLIDDIVDIISRL